MCIATISSNLNGITNGDWLQFVSSLLLGGASLFLSALAYKYSFLKGAEINVFQTDTEPNIESSNGFSGMYEYLDLNVSFNIQNTGFATATVISIKVVPSYKMKGKVYMTTTNLTKTSEPTSLIYKIPFILRNGESELINLRLRTELVPGIHREYSLKNDGVVEISKIPNKISYKIFIEYKNGRGKDKQNNGEVFMKNCKKIINIAKTV